MNLGTIFLGCSHGPLRIQCHDSQVFVVHHALLQDHPGVLCEQGASTSDHSCPGNIYHPNFCLGHPAYFDLSVRCITQSASTASQAGVVAAAGERAKDNQYLDRVNNTGGDFIPLVCKIFGVWSPFALSSPFSIANRSTVRNGLPLKIARK